MLILTCLSVLGAQEQPEALLSFSPDEHLPQQVGCIHHFLGGRGQL